jgi:alginate O-acetyltransferase complex protein AlgI
MSFASAVYLVFLALAFCCALLFPKRYILFFMFFASFIFYSWWDWRFFGLLVLSACVGFFSGILIDRRRNPNLHERYRKLLLIVSISVDLGILFVFKYFNYFVGAIDVACRQLHCHVSFHTIQIILPIGISFHTFQNISYAIDVYRGKTESTERFMDYLVYITFFPQLLAGPIERAGTMLPKLAQLREGFSKRSDLAGGIFQIAHGLFLKLVIADNLAGYVDAMYRNINGYSPFGILMGVYFFSVQIYCDFYGYTLIALGSARLFGINLTNNFDHPYLVENIQEFWRRWHITLTNWFRDYVYIPLGGNRVSLPRTALNILIIMGLVGLLHGANITFVLWGVCHGVALGLHRAYLYVIERFRIEIPNRARKPLKIISFLLTFHFVAFAWILFRAKDLGAATCVFTGILKVNTTPDRHGVCGYSPFFVFILMIFILLEIADRFAPLRKVFTEASIITQCIILILFGISMYIAGANNVQFIYFQF